MSHVGCRLGPRAALRTVAMLALLVTALAGCGTARSNSDSASDSSVGHKDSAQSARSIRHELGTAAITGTPRRVVALELSFVDALTTLGVEPVGIADDGKPDMVNKLVGRSIDYTSVGTRGEPSLEVITSLDPDLIIADSQRHAAIHQQLQEIAPAIVLVSREATYQDILSDFTTIADAIGRQEQARRSLAAHETAFKRVAARVPAGKKPSVMLCVARPDSFNCHTSSSYDGAVFKLLGFRNAIASDVPFRDLGLEELSRLDPGVLLVASNDGRTVVDGWKGNAVWKGLTAVRDQRVLEVDRDLWTRFRGVKVSEIMAASLITTLYPSR